MFQYKYEKNTSSRNSEVTPLLSAQDVNNYSSLQNEREALPRILYLPDRRTINPILNIIFQYMEQEELAEMGLDSVGKQLLLQVFSDKQCNALMIQIFGPATLEYLQQKRLSHRNNNFRCKSSIVLFVIIILVFSWMALILLFPRIFPLDPNNRLLALIETFVMLTILVAIGMCWTMGGTVCAAIVMDAICDRVAKYHEKTAIRDLLPTLEQENQRGLAWVLKSIQADRKTFEQVETELTKLCAHYRKIKVKIGFFEAKSELKNELIDIDEGNEEESKSSQDLMFD